MKHIKVIYENLDALLNGTIKNTSEILKTQKDLKRLELNLKSGASE